MALSLPPPAAPSPASPAQARAHRKWRDGQSAAQRDLWPQAALDFEQAFQLHGDAAYGLAAAHAFIKAGRSDVAVQRAQGLRRACPSLTLAYTLESHALLERGRPADAVSCLLALPADAPRDAPHWVSLGVALQRCHRHDDAIAAFMQALALKIDDGIVHFRLGMSFKDKGLKAEAAECVRTALLLGLDTSELSARAQLLFLEREACRWPQARDEMARLRAAVQAAPDAPVETGAFPHAVLVDDPLEVLKVARLYARHIAGRVAPLPRRAARAHAGRLRIGYLSADFHQHATSQLMAQMLECHDRERFEVTLFSAGADDGSPMRARIAAACERFEDLRGLTHPAMAQRIRERQIDILVDVKGATHGTLMPVTAHRAAPLQVSWLGFPGSSGADEVDYLIGDAVVTPLAHAAHFSEKIAQLPLCYQPNDARRALPQPSRRSDWGAPEGVPLLCAFHQSYKISEEVFERWCALLHAVPGAVLWLMRWNANVQASLEAAARARGIGPERLCFAPMLPLDQHLSRLACADLYLDAWPCNAHTTAGEALWVGVPVVTLIGPTFAQRVAASLLKAVALPELVCDSAEAYADTVQALCADAPRRQHLREHLIAQRQASPLFDGARFARDIEALYERMWARAVAGLPPEHLPAA
jgi:predicted O-linked N-acetylglucosamine transferase (SPINDLY family)